MYRSNNNGFTLVELMVVLMIISILFLGLYMGVQPYMSRARDTKRVTALLQYTPIIEGYEKNFDTFPSNYGSGSNPLAEGYCLTELGTRTFDSPTDSSMKFSALNNGVAIAPQDPIHDAVPIGPCTMSGSYLYSRMSYSTNSEIAILAARLELSPSANYGTGADLTNPGRIQNIIDAKKSTIPEGTSDLLYVVSLLR